jgi:2-haloacid dehalogenase
MGIRKPDPSIYQRVMGILGKPAPRTLFIDDRLENVAAAAAVGMKAIQFTGEGQLREQLSLLGVC